MQAAEIWLALEKGSRRHRTKVRLTYLEAVEEALCFGWVDGIGKSLDGTHTAQRFTPRKRRSHWTELNKERARRLIAEGRMTDAGARILPDLDPASFRIPNDIREALSRDPEVWKKFQSSPRLYQRVRVGYVDELRRGTPDFDKRLSNLIEKTRAGVLFGNWNDDKLRR